MQGFCYRFDDLALLQHKFERLSLEQGLSQMVVHAILQDNQGFMWFCTVDGLNKFDGYSFSLYRNDYRNANSLSHNYLLSICEDDSGSLWLGTFQGGLNRFDLKREQFTRFRHNARDPRSLADDIVHAVYQDRSGRLWIGTDSGLDQYDPATDSFIHHRRGNKDSTVKDPYRVKAIVQGASGQMWIATQGNGLDVFNPETGTWEHFHHRDDRAYGISHDSVSALCPSRDGSLWIGTEGGGLNRMTFDSAGKPVFHHYRHEPGQANSLASDFINVLYEDGNGHLWIGTRDGGLDVLEPAAQKFINFRNHKNDENSISGDNIVSLYEDRSGVLWIGTFRNGLSKLNRSKMQFTHINAIPDESNSLSDNFIWSICEDDRGTLWVGSYSGGLDGFDRIRKRWVHFKHDPKDPGSLNENRIRIIHQDRRGRLWVGTDGAGFALMERDSGRFTRFQNQAHQTNSLSHNSIRCFYEDREGMLWIGTAGGGMNKFDPEQGSFTHYLMDDKDAASLSSNHIRAILEDDQGQIWIGTEGSGLNRMDRRSGRCTLYQADPRQDGHLSNNYIFTLFQDREKRIWIGTWGGGLNRYFPESDSFTCYTKEQGLADDVVYGILEDEAGKLWMSTNRGISRFDPESLLFTNFSVEDGLQSLEFNAGAYYKSAHGELFFGGVNGLNSFFPDKICKNPSIPPVVLTSFRKLNQEFKLQEPLAFVKEIELTYEDYYFSLEFAALDYRASMKNQYAYMLEGLDSDWIYTDAGKRTVSYTTLAPGKYTFRVKASNNTGVWNEAGTSVRIIIHPPFWQTWWFVSALIALAAAVVVYGVRLRLKSLMAVEKVRSKIAADLHDNIGASLTEISILGEVTQKKLTTDPETARKQIAKISEIARNLIDSMSDIVWLIHPQRDTLYDLILKLKDTYNELFLTRNILFTTSDLGVLKDTHLSMEYKHQLYLLLKEALNNCLRHSHCSTVDLIVSYQNKMLEINLIDNGQGISDQDSLGNGLINMKKRADMLGGKLVIETRANTGTMIVFTVHLKKHLHLMDAAR